MNIKLSLRTNKRKEKEKDMNGNSDIIMWQYRTAYVDYV